MKYVFDLDGTICTLTDGNYSLAKPFADRISFINKLYDNGNDIIIYTARGMSSGDIHKAQSRYFSFTETQLKNWGVKYSELILGKPSGDFYIDDKGVCADDFF